MTDFRNRSIAVLGALVATFATVTAAAPVHAESVEVHYGDLDLASPADAATLRHRIRHAATAVCGSSDPLTRMAVAECRRTAIARAEASAASLAPRTLLAQR